MPALQVSSSENQIENPLVKKTAIMDDDTEKMVSRQSSKDWEVVESPGDNNDDESSNNPSNNNGETSNEDVNKEEEASSSLTTATTTIETKSKNDLAQEQQQRYKPQKDEHRPSLISVIVNKESKDDMLGIGIDENHKTGEIYVVKVVPDGLLSSTPIHVGDQLLSVNGMKCNKNLQKVGQRLKSCTGNLIIQVHNTKGHPNLIQAMVTTATATTQTNNTANAVRKSLSRSSSFNISNGNNNKIGINFYQKDNGQAGLYVQNRTFRGGILKRNDRILSINGIPCHNLKPDQVYDMIEKLNTNYVDIVAMRLNQQQSSSSSDGDDEEPSLTRSQSFLKNARKAAIGVGGGAMVGVGLVFIPTLPPPFGEVLIAGGVSLLGTEFEAPKKVVRSARNSLSRAVGPAEEEKNQTRLKNFSRKHVIPFLDQVVGDNKGGNQSDKVIIYKIGAAVSTPYGHGIVSNYRNDVGLYVVKFINWTATATLRADQISPRIAQDCYVNYPCLTTFGLSGILSNVQSNTGIHVVKIPSLPGTVCYLQPDSIRKPLKAAVGENVSTPYGRGTVTKYRLEDDVYEIRLVDGESSSILYATEESFTRSLSSDDNYRNNNKGKRLSTAKAAAYGKKMSTSIRRLFSSTRSSLKSEEVDEVNNTGPTNTQQ